MAKNIINDSILGADWIIDPAATSLDTIAIVDVDVNGDAPTLLLDPFGQVAGAGVSNTSSAYGGASGTGMAAAVPAPSAPTGGDSTDAAASTGPAAGPSGISVISVARDNSSSLSPADDQNISALLCGFGWGTTNITFSFPDSSADYGTSQGTGGGQYNDPAPFTGFGQFSTQEIGETLRAFGLLASYTKLTFTQITETTTTHATLRLANSSAPPTSYAYNPGVGDIRGGDVFIGPSARNPVMGNYASGQALIHEIGHALGLSHGHDGSSAYGVMNADRTDIEFALMDYPSYIGAPAGTVLASTVPQTYMMYDIAALQHIYGANFGNVGQNLTYTWSSSTGEEFINGVSQGTPVDNHIFETIWTGGANSTYDLSNFGQDQVDDLRPGAWMKFSNAQLADLNASAPSKPSGEIFARGDVFNALEYNGDARSLIGNITAGSGNDTITGNDANNVINAGVGNDTINGEGAHNTLTGGVGADKFIHDSSIPSGAFDEITDYDRGNSGTYNAGEGDQIDLSALLAAAYNKGSGAPVSSLVRTIEDPSGTFATLQIDTDGSGSSWMTIGQLDGIHLGNAINVILDASQSAGTTISASGRQLTFIGANINGSFDPNWNDYTTVTVVSNGLTSTSYFSHWTGSSFPTASDELTITNNIACILSGQEFDGSSSFTDAADSLTIIAGSSLTINSELDLGSGAGNGGVALNNAGPVSVGDNAFLHVSGGINNSSTITLHAGPQLGSKLLVNTPTVSLAGGGSIVLTDAVLSRIEAGVAGGTLDNTDGTIAGVGQVGLGTSDGPALTLKNEALGTIVANVDGGLLTINTADKTLVNKGLIKAENGGSLLIQTAIDSTGGVIQNLSGVLTVSATTIAGGTWVSSGNNPITIAGDSAFDGSAHPVTIAGNPGFAGVISVSDNSFLNTKGSIVNTGVIKLNAGPQLGSKLLVDSAAVSLSGGGSIILTDAVLSRIEARVAGGTLDNLNNTISGTGQIGLGVSDGPALTLTNEAAATINANVTGKALTIDTAGVTLVNKGLIEATNSSTLVINSTINNTGGMIYAAGGDILLSNARIAGGRLLTSANNAINVTGNSTLDGSVNAPSNEENLSVADNVFVTVLGSIVNSGDIILHAGPQLGSKLLIGSTTFRLSGSGFVLLTDSNLSRIEAGVAGAVLDNVDNTISGTGQIGLGVSDGPALTLTNEASGTINANVGTGITINTATIPLINKGLIEATNGSTLVVNSTINNTGGVINALAGGVTLSNATIAGGTLKTSGGNAFNVTGNSTLDGSANVPNSTGAVSVADNVFLTVLGSITNTGTITLHAGPQLGSKLLIGSPSFTLTGGGSIVLSDPGLSRIEAGLAGAMLDNVDNTISGAGQIGLGTNDGPALTLTNEASGIINASSGGGITINTATIPLVNKGLIEVTNGSTLVVNSTINNTGGVINALAGGVNLANATIAGGTLKTSGGNAFNVTANSTLDGSVNAPNNTGAVSVADNVFLTVLGNIANTGTITVHAGPQLASRLLVGSAPVTLTGGGSIVLTDSGLSRIEGSVAGATLDNIGNTISGSGQIGLPSDGGPGLALKNEVSGTIDANVSGGILTITTGSTVTNNGVLEADGGKLVVNDAVTGTGHVLITNGGTAALTGNFQQNVTFSGAGTLALPEIAVATGGGYIGRVVGMGTGDVLDIPTLAFKSSYDVLASSAGGGVEGLFVRDTAVLDTAQNPSVVAELLMIGTDLSRNFSVADDGHGGTKVSWQVAGPVPAPGVPTLSAASDSGAKGDNATNIKTPVITGKGEVGDNVILFDTPAGGTPVAIGGATVQLNGTWSVTSTLSSGLHTLTATETDPLGNASPASAALALTILPAESPAVLNNFGWQQGWGSPNNPRFTADVNGDGSTDYLGFGFSAVFIGYGGTFAGDTDPTQTGPGFSSAGPAVTDFGTNEGYTAVVQRGAAATGAGVGDVLYGQGFAGVYWYAATSATPQTDAAGNTYNVLNYQTSPNLYGNFGSQQGWSPANGFQIVKATAGDPFASILGFGSDGIVVGPQAFAPGADASVSYLIPFGAGNNSGWNAQNDVRTFTDAKGNTIDLNHDGIADFVGMGPQGLTFAFGSNSGGKYQLGTLQYAKLNGTSDDPNVSDDLGDNKGWSNAATLRFVVADPQTGFDDILAFGNFGVTVAPGQDPATHGGQPFGQLYLAMPDFGANQGWSVQQTPRIVGDVNGDGIPDIVGFGATSTFVAVGSRDAGGNINFALDPNLTAFDFGYTEGWSGSDPQTVRALADFKTAGTSHSDLVLSGAFNTQVWHFT